ncbi:MAG: ComEC/Rec2 family competence protein [Lachnospiraceae bacterium]|nr:ComEC/Rec2 family competence protein [Lachnospiraceae bacterium]
MNKIWIICKRISEKEEIIIKRPLFAAAMGFVLGEVCVWCAESGRNQNTVGSHIPAIAAAVFAAVMIVILVIAIVAAAGFADALFPVDIETDFWGWKRKICGKSRSMYSGLWILLLFCAFLSGCFRMRQVTEWWNHLEALCPEEGEWIQITGRVSHILETTWSDAVELETEEYGKILVYVEGEAVAGSQRGTDNWDSQEPAEASSVAKKLQIGQWVEAEGEAGCFEPARNPGQFDFKQYYRSRGISMSLSADRLESRGANGMGSPYFDGLYRFRCRCSQILEQICEAVDRGIFQAAILGEKGGMDSEIRDLYQKNGISHMLAISGLHLSMIGMGLYRLLRKSGMGYGLAGSVAGAVIVSYGVMTGGSGSAVRAIIMLLASFLAAYLGRTYDLLSALSLAALLLSWANPLLIGQSGFQLSFGAVLGIGLLGEEFVRSLKVHRSWEKTLLVSLSVQLMTCPIVLYHYFQYPVYGIFLNLLVVPLMGYVVLSGLLGIAAGFLSLPLGTAAVGSGHYILQWYQVLCQIFARFPGGQAVFGRPKWIQIAVYYGILAAMVLGMRGIMRKSDDSGNRSDENERNIVLSGRENRKDKTKARKSGWTAFGMLTAGTISCFICLSPLRQKGCDAVFLDVGQGDGIVIQCEGGMLQMCGLELADRGSSGEIGGENNGQASCDQEAGADTAGEAVLKGRTRNPGRAVILVDGGSTSEKKLGKNRLEPYLKSCGIGMIDFALVSHGDEDHISGLRYLLEECEKITIRHLVLPELGKGDSAYDRLIQAAVTAGTQIWYMDAGDRIQAGGCELTCLYPQKGEEIDASDRNQQSLILQVDYGSFHMLLTGDADEEGERRLAARQGEQLARIQVLKAAHHGSRYSNSEELLDAAQPDLAVISYQKGNSYGHPHKEAVERMEQAGCEILKTGEQGAVFLHAEGEMLRYWTYLQGE